MVSVHYVTIIYYFFFFSSRRRHTRCSRDWSSDVCSSDLYRVVVLLYAALGAVLALLFTRLSPATEVAASDATATRFGIGRSRAVVLRLSGLFALDAFAGGFVIQSFAAYWFYLRFDVNPATLGMIF